MDFLPRAYASRPISFTSTLMDTQTYPGRGLSLSQLAFALNEELKRVAYSSPYVANNGLFSDCLKYDMLIASADSLWRRSPNSTKMLQSRWQPFASGGIHSPASTASRLISFPSSPPTSPPRRIVSVPLLCAVIGVGSSLNGAHYGHGCSSKKARSACRPSSNARKDRR